MPAPAPHPLTAWLEAPTPTRALVIEDGRTGTLSPLANWLEDVRAMPRHDLISVAMGPTESMFLERDIFVKLYVELYPDGADEPAAFSLWHLRRHVRSGLRSQGPQTTRLVALDRANWAEPSFQRNLGYLLDRLTPEQKIVVSLRADDEREPDLTGWCERLGWRTEHTLFLRLPALLELESSPMHMAREWAEAIPPSGAGEPGVLDVLAAAMRPMRTEEIAAILGTSPDAADALIRLAPKSALVIDEGGRHAFHDPAVARAFTSLRLEASDRVRSRVLALGQSAERGDSQNISAYVLQHHGVQVALIDEPWARAWASAGDLLGFEADVERVWFAARRELLANGSASAAQRAQPLLTILRCMQVSSSVMHRVRNLRSTAHSRAHALAALAEELEEPQRTRVREHAVEALLATDLEVSGADLLMQLAKWLDGERRDVIIEKVLAMYRADLDDGHSSVWLLRAAPLVSIDARRALCDEVVATLRSLPEYDASTLRDALGALPSEVAYSLLPALPALPLPDRLRFACALAPHLEGDARRDVVEGIQHADETALFQLQPGDVRSISSVLEADELISLGRALQRLPYHESLVGICLRALFALGHAGDAELLAGADPAAMPFDSVLALAVNMGDRRPELRAELASRLVGMDEITLGWTIDRDAAELVSALGVEPLLGLARRIASDEERIVARVALVPFVDEATKRALATEAVQVFRESIDSEELHWGKLLAILEWMSVPDACHVLVHGSYDFDGLSVVEFFAPVLERLGGGDLSPRLADQIIEIGRWAP